MWAVSFMLLFYLYKISKNIYLPRRHYHLHLPIHQLYEIKFTLHRCFWELSVIFFDLEPFSIWDDFSHFFLHPSDLFVWVELFLSASSDDWLFLFFSLLWHLLITFVLSRQLLICNAISFKNDSHMKRSIIDFFHGWLWCLLFSSCFLHSVLCSDFSDFFISPLFLQHPQGRKQDLHWLTHSGQIAIWASSGAIWESLGYEQDR